MEAVPLAMSQACASVAPERLLGPSQSHLISKLAGSVPLVSLLVMAWEPNGILYKRCFGIEHPNIMHVDKSQIT